MASATWTRRKLLGTAGVAGLATAGWASSRTASAGTRTFDLSARARALYTGATLASATVQQSFTFDPENDRLFVAQLKAGSPGVAGDLHVSEVDRRGRLLGAMVLLGYGHAVSFAAQAFRGGTYLWTEGEANANGYGTVLKRFAWENGATLSRDDPRATTFRPVPEALETTCAIDHDAGRMAVRYHTSAGKRIAIFRLADVAAGGAPDRIADVAQPPGLGVFQGYALYGSDIYTLDGTAYGDTNPPPGNAYLSRIDTRTGELAERVLTHAGADLVYREPEGMAVGGFGSGAPRLYFGFASGAAGARRSNLFYL
ncbi:phage baseplate protein [Microlunatus parietis]|uniref:P68 RBP/TagC-like beta-propeller domain-containing protein n=1 Tax=Microlunatus parietis TaxID=682979 RepID=A0A7Y9I8D8_9ACTN|nr:teichoic acid biosynthesis protein C [Microlunatus parietis]NYE71965.1 hypothetical protein [Microlunatus parietis]